MEPIRRTITIDKTTDEVWAAIADFQAIGDFHPYITNVDLNTEHNGGLGAKRTCYFNDGTTIDEEIIEWRDGESLKINATNFSFPFKVLHGTLGVKEVDGKSEAFMMMGIVPKFGIIGKLMVGTMMRKMMSKRMDEILRGLDELMSTGQPAKRAT